MNNEMRKNILTPDSPTNRTLLIKGLFLLPILALFFVGGNMIEGYNRNIGVCIAIAVSCLLFFTVDIVFIIKSKNDIVFDMFCLGIIPAFAAFWSFFTGFSLLLNDSILLVILFTLVCFTSFSIGWFFFAFQKKE